MVAKKYKKEKWRFLFEKVRESEKPL